MSKQQIRDRAINGAYINYTNSLELMNAGAHTCTRSYQLKQVWFHYMILKRLILNVR